MTEKAIVTRNRAPDNKEDGGMQTILKEIRVVTSKLDNVEQQLTSKVDGLQMSLEKTLKEELQKLKDNFDSEIGSLKARMEQLEEKIKSHQRTSDTFDPDLSVVVMGLPYQENENLTEKIKDVIENGCACDQEVTLVALERLRARGPGPGVVKVAFASVREKVAVLRGKANLKSNDKFRKVYIRTAKSHTDRVMEENFKVLLRDLPNGKDYYVSGNGKLLRRTAPDAAPPSLRGAAAAVELSGYRWLGNNRKRHILAPKGSGGVGLLVKDELVEQFEVNVVDKSVDDGLDKAEMKSIFPPGGSPRGTLRTHSQILTLPWGAVLTLSPPSTTNHPLLHGPNSAHIERIVWVSHHQNRPTSFFVVPGGYSSEPFFNLKEGFGLDVEALESQCGICAAQWDTFAEDKCETPNKTSQCTFRREEWCDCFNHLDLDTEELHRNSSVHRPAYSLMSVGAPRLTNLLRSPTVAIFYVQCNYMKKEIEWRERDIEIGQRKPKQIKQNQFYLPIIVSA
ncbi:hypothetical protein WMY93_013368 [Mugilogobius chulae]|uniref:L1 transposable element RRM domain-containing protein n=1 Tax=Mugilogobius chulae TaxID=88201 RepID=A0AAW0P8X5_9GOBI